MDVATIAEYREAFETAFGSGVGLFDRESNYRVYTTNQPGVFVAGDCAGWPAQPNRPRTSSVIKTALETNRQSCCCGVGRYCAPAAGCPR